VILPYRFGVLRFLLRPRWLAWHAALVVVLVAFTWLGSWQLGSFEHRGDRSGGGGAAVALEAVQRPGGRLANDDVARLVVARGRYDAARQLLVPGREHDGRTGLLVVIPLRTARGVLPVVRGWVPRAASAATRVPAGPVTLTGRLQPSEPREASGVDPLAALRRGRVPYVASVVLLDAWPYAADQVYDGYVVATRETPPGAAPAPARVTAARPSGGVAPWRNLAYALQWWLFMLAAVFFWGSVLRRGWADEHLPSADVASPAAPAEEKV
jgi:cytochrome oxidase assembly protein ShyY1